MILDDYFDCIFSHWMNLENIPTFFVMCLILNDDSEKLYKYRLFYNKNGDIE